MTLNEIIAQRDEFVHRANELQKEVNVNGWNISLTNKARKLSEELDTFNAKLKAMSH